MAVLASMFGHQHHKDLVQHTHEKQYMGRIVGSLQKAQLGKAEVIAVYKALLLMLKVCVSLSQCVCVCK